MDNHNPQGSLRLADVIDHTGAPIEGVKVTWAVRKYLDIRERGAPDACAYCHVGLTDDNRTLDHVIPRARGGSNATENLVLACVKCNREKGDMSVEDYTIWKQAKVVEKAYIEKHYRVPPLTHRIVIEGWEAG